MNVIRLQNILVSNPPFTELQRSLNKSGFEHGLWTYQHQKSGQEQLSSNSFETEQGYRMIVDFNS